MEEESIVRKNKAKILNERENDNQYFYTYSRNAKLYYFKDNIFFLLHFDEDNFPYYIEILEFDENNEDIFNFTNSIRIRKIVFIHLVHILIFLLDLQMI